MNQLQCPVCDYPHPSLRFRLGDRFFATTAELFKLYGCRGCGLVFQDPEEVEGRLQEFYPEGYWWKGAGRLTGLERAYREWVLRRDQLGFLLSLFPRPRGMRLLDVGCGSGTFVKLACRAGFDAWGLEQSEEAVRIAQEEAPDRVRRISEKELAEKGESFDVVTLFHTLEHVPRPFPYVRDLKKLIREKGWLVVQVPNVASMQAKLLGSRWYGLDCPRHVVNYTPFALMQLLGRAGYRIHKLRHFSVRDNAASLVSSLFPLLDPMSQRVKLFRSKGVYSSPALAVRQGLYLPMLLLAQPFALMEAALGRGATCTVVAGVD